MHEGDSAHGASTNLDLVNRTETAGVSEEGERRRRCH